MARKGRQFELAYKKLYDMLDKSIYTISSPGWPIDKTTGRRREVDVLIEYTDANGNHRRISIECRDRSAVQDITWIEQLVQKREDLDLDYTIATTTTSFSEGAIDKAKYHGIVIEQAEMPTKDTIDKLRDTTFVDFFFFKIKLLEFKLLFDSDGYILLKDFLTKMNIIDRNVFIREINTAFFFGIEPAEIINQHPKAADYFSSEDNRLELNGTIMLNDDMSLFWKNAKAIAYKIEVEPRKLSLPIVNYFYAFNTQNHFNKKYHGDFQSDSDYFSVAFIDGKLVTHLGLKKRRFWRITGSSMNLNTVLPENAQLDVDGLISEITNNYLGEFDLSEVL